MSRSSGVDSLGQENGAWSDISTVWARVTVLPGSAATREEIYKDGQTIATQIKRVVIRYNPSIPTRWRLVHRGQAHDITNVSTLGRNAETQVMCTAGVRDGR